MMTPEELDRARWARLEDAESALAAVADALGHADLAEVRRHAADLAAIAQQLTDL